MACTDCDPGTIAGKSAMSQCTDCDPGTISAAARSTPIDDLAAIALTQWAQAAKATTMGLDYNPDTGQDRKRPIIFHDRPFAK